MTKKRRIGMLSFAHMHARSYAAVLAQCADRAEVVGVYHEEPQAGKEYVARFPGAVFYPDYERLLDQGLDGVIVCSVNADHCEHVTAAAAKVPYILCEKPLATTSADGRKMIEACRKHGAELMVAYPCRYVPTAVRARQRVQNGDLGKVIAALSTNHGSMPGGWFTEPKRSGGGAVMDHTVHVADLWRWILGFEVRTVFAETTTALHEIPVEDCGLLSVTFDSGAIGTLDCSWSRPKSYPIWGDVSIQFVGEKGVLEMDLFSQNLHWASNRAGKTVHIPFGDNPDQLMMADFLAMMETGGKSPIPGGDGLRSLEVAVAAYRSVAAGRPEELPLE